ncbi:hypothetical protein BH11MYX1_BH11MYX1_55870 [soil metagenome]
MQIAFCVCLLGHSSEGSPAEFVPTETTPDAPPRTNAPNLVFRESSNLDGTYLWLGPSGVAGYIDSQWDSAFGVDASIVRVREHEALSALGFSIGASRWTEHSGGRVWVDAMIGTPVLDHTVGISVGPIVEIGELSHPLVGGSVGIWGFLGVTPFARVGTLQSLGTFAEFGVHIALPALRR